MCHLLPAFLLGTNSELVRVGHETLDGRDGACPVFPEPRPYGTNGQDSSAPRVFSLTSSLRMIASAISLLSLRFFRLCFCRPTQAGSSLNPAAACKIPRARAPPFRR